MKKIVSLVLMICILCSVCGISVYAAYDNDATASYGGKTLPIGNYKNGKTYKDTFGGAKQCLGFAFYVQNKLFGVYYKNTGNVNGDKFIVKKGNNGNILLNSIEDTKALFRDVTLGSHIRTGKAVKEDKNGKKYSHSMIFMKSDSSYVWTYEGNADGAYGVHIVKRSWEKMYNYLKYTKNGVIYIAIPRPELYSKDVSSTGGYISSGTSTSATTTAKPSSTSCSHSYNNRGYCNKCGKEYAISLSSMNATYEAVKNDVPVRNRPYSPDSIIKYLSKGTKVTVVASGKNSVGNLWYKLNNGTWIYSENLTRSSGSTSSGSSSSSSSKPASSSSSIKISLDSYPKGNLKYGKSFSLSGKFTSDCAIVEARAYMLDSNKNVIMEAKGSSTTSNYYIKGYALDKGMKFGSLKPGGYYLKYYVKDANGDTATWVSDKFYIVK